MLFATMLILFYVCLRFLRAVASDPLKLAAMRAVMRARTAHLSQHPESTQNDADFYQFSRFMLKPGEHTWGVDVKTFLGGS
jgi:hypothetical protein